MINGTFIIRVYNQSDGYYTQVFHQESEQSCLCYNIVENKTVYIFFDENQRIRAEFQKENGKICEQNFSIGFEDSYVYITNNTKLCLRYQNMMPYDSVCLELNPNDTPSMHLFEWSEHTAVGGSRGGLINRISHDR